MGEGALALISLFFLTSGNAQHMDGDCDSLFS